MRPGRIRKALIIVSLLLFPVTLNCFSPYIITDATSQGIVNGSMVVFGLQFVSALFAGRLWCGWACPAAGLGEVDWIKWLIWVPWLSIIVLMAIRAGGYQRVDLLHLTESGISVDEPQKYFVYFTVVGVFLALSAFVGRRAGCHTICWMAPFMILGRKLRNLVGWPALHRKAESSRCIDCKACTRNCPMSLDVNEMVRQRAMENSECVLCGTCIDVCPKDVIRYRFGAGRPQAG